MQISLSKTEREPPRHKLGALWNLGFRPFYFLASFFSAASILVWLAEYFGRLPLDAYLRGPMWHAHEMLFGYTVAVAAGFLLTAVRVWTGRATPTGLPLTGLAALWVAGRILVLTPYAGLAAAVNVAFPVAIAATIAIPLIQSGNRRNYFFIGVLAFLGAAELAFHLSVLGLIHLPPTESLGVALDAFLFLLVVMGGRVIPMFTNNGVPNARARRLPVIETLAPASILALLACDLLALPASVLAIVAAACAVIHGCRLWLWHPWRTLRVPLVWILHAGYAWIVVHLVLRAFVASHFVPGIFAIHALTVGAIGSLTLGMMTRTALGHTARPLSAGILEVWCYTLVQLAAIVRVFGGIFVSSQLPLTILMSGLLWSLAFTLYAVGYWPILSRVRLDGKPG